MAVRRRKHRLVDSRRVAHPRHRRRRKRLRRVAFARIGQRAVVEENERGAGCGDADLAIACRSIAGDGLDLLFAGWAPVGLHY